MPGQQLQSANTQSKPETTLHISSVEDGVLNFINLVENPIVSVYSWPDITSESKIWLYREYTFVDGHSESVALAEAEAVETNKGERLFSYEFPLNELSVLGDNTIVTFTLITCNNGNASEETNYVTQHRFQLRNPATKASGDRWMTEISTSIGKLKPFQLALPGAHNSAADNKLAFYPEKQWATCQDDSFAYQLGIGVRYFDLRILDDTDDTREYVIFEHGIANLRHRLADAVNVFISFAQRNPKELIFLDLRLHENLADSAARCVRYLQPLDPFLVPPEMLNSTIENIYKNHPNKNIIILAGSNLKSLNNKFWNPPHSVWAGEDYSLDNLNNFTNGVRDTLQHNGSLIHKFWKFSATARDANGALRMTHNQQYWTDFFKIGATKGLGQKCNIIYADYINDTRLIEFCIDQNASRGGTRPNDAPFNLNAKYTVIQNAKADPDPDPDKYKVELAWRHFSDAYPQYYYEIYEGEQFLTRATDTNATFNIKQPGLYRYRVCHVETQGIKSKFAEVVLEVAETDAPSAPSNLKLDKTGFTSTHLTWTASTSGSSNIAGYEVYKNEALQPFTSVTNYAFSNLAENSGYEFKVRAKDTAGKYSPFVYISLGVRPPRKLTPQFVGGPMPGNSYWVGFFLIGLIGNLDPDHHYETRLNTKDDGKVPANRSPLASVQKVLQANVQYTYEARAVLPSGEMSEWGSVTVKYP